MGERGPVPKRNKRRRNKPDGPPPKGGKGSGTEEWVAYATSIDIDVPEGASRAEVMELVADHGVDEEWHPLAQQWYDALRQSGQSRFYQPSDWAFAAIVAEAISRELKPQPMTVGSGEFATIEMVKLPPKGTSLKAWLEAMTQLLVTEGARRRMRIELDNEAADGEETPDVSDLDEYRARRGSG